MHTRKASPLATENADNNDNDDGQMEGLTEKWLSRMSAIKNNYQTKRFYCIIIESKVIQ